MDKHDKTQLNLCLDWFNSYTKPSQKFNLINNLETIRLYVQHYAGKLKHTQHIPTSTILHAAILLDYQTKYIVNSTYLNCTIDTFAMLYLPIPALNASKVSLLRKGVK